MTSWFFIVAACIPLVQGQTPMVQEGLKFIDLSHTFGHKTLYWPENHPFNYTLTFRSPFTNGIVAESYFIETAEHSGTHMDAPRHFCSQGVTVDEIPLNKMHGPGVMLNFRNEAKMNVDFEVTVKHIQDWEKVHGQIPDKAIVLLNFGWNDYWADFNKAFKTDDMTNFTSFHWPALSEAGAEFLVTERNIVAMGTDAASADRGLPNPHKTHINLLCKHGRIILENIANIDNLPAVGSMVFIGAIKLEGGTGTPVRLFATVGSGGGKATTGIAVLIAIFNIILALV